MEQGNGLLSLGNPKALNFSSDGGAQAVWKGSVTLTEASVGSGSSAIVSASGDDGPEQKQSTLDLKEHDYIGLADVSSSVKPSHDTPSPKGLSLPETDLHLGLGLGLGLGPAKKTNATEESEKTLAFTLTQKDGAPKAAAMESPRYTFTEAAQAMQKTWPNAGHLRPITAENLTSARDFQAPKACMHVQDYGEGTSRVGGNAFYGGHTAALKNGTKRGYMEAMNEAARFNAVTEVRAAAAAVKNGDGDAKVLPKHQQGAFMPNWVPSKPAAPAHWQGGLEQSSVHSFGPNKSAPLMTLPRGEKPTADLAHTAYKPHDPSSEVGKEPATDEPPPPKGQAVGWPPIRSYRKHTLAKPTEMFVKVNMDGMTVGRKVDLNAHSSYAGLLLALEEMFQPSNNGGQGTSQSASGRDNNITDVKQLRLLNGSDFVLTYEDQDGDLMLVGDLPWSMFVNMVRRLHITRGSEAIGLAPRRPDIIK